MATPAYGTHTLTNSSTSSPYVIDKPASLAEGDLMIAHLFSYGTGGGATPVFTPPAGWTTLTEELGGESLGIYAKVASSVDAAASNFSFTITSDGTWNTRGAIIRITANSDFDVSLIQASSSFDGTGDTTFEDTGLTPNFSNGLYLILLGMDSASGRSVSGYAFATDNPTWNELYDTAAGSAADIAAAWATRSSANATGTVSATASGTVDDEATAVVFIPSITIVSPDGVSIASSVADVYVPTKILETPLSLTFTPNSPTVEDGANPYSNVSKNSEDWTNVQKS